MFLQLMIIVTGNYNFFNLLTMTLCLSLVDDDFLLGIQRRSGKPGKLRTLANVAARTIALAVYCGLFYGTVKLFHLRFDNNWALHSKIGFTSAKLNQFLGSAMPILMWVAAASLAFHILVSFYRSLVNEKGVLSKIFSTLGTIIMGTAAVWVFCISLVPLSQLDAGMNRKLWPTIRTWHYKVEPFHLTSPYGLFRRMTGVGGRPELVLEGSDDPNGPWVELPFLYKPGDVNRSPPFIIPTSLG
uniref:Lipase maturation factor n=1 Tax=Amblyomma triste TaxID=251400 RepID=A0A023GGY2_AMBTT